MANIGITLRSARIQRGLTIEQVAQDTRISARFLDALESEAFDELPAPVYVRGFLRSYATYLRLDPQEILEHLDPSLGGGGGRSIPAHETAQAPGRRPDPFRPAAPIPAPPPPARPRFVENDDSRYDDPQPVLEHADPFSARRVESETPLDPGYESPYRRGRVGGVLVERGAVYEGSGGAARVVALVGGALILLLVFAGIAMALSGGGGDDDDDTVQGGGANTPANSGTGTIVVGGARTGTATASVTTSVTGIASTTTTADSTPTPGTGTTATPTPTEPGSIPTAAATPTQQPPTSTPVPPTPTPTKPPVVLPGVYGYEECKVIGSQQFDCSGSSGDFSSYRVVCYPGGWFLDVDKNYQNSQGFPEATVTGPSLGNVVTYSSTCPSLTG